VGLWEALLGTDAVVRFMLQEPIVEIFWQSGLLRENLLNWSINWIVFDRVAPFGTFVNEIDYAIFLAAILSLESALVIARFEQRVIPANRKADTIITVVLLAIAAFIGGTLLLTFKGSGVVALAGGAVTAGILYLPRLSRRTIGIGSIALVVIIVLALPFEDLIAQRAAFLIQREQGAYGTAGRIEIWANLFQYFVQRPLFGFGLHNSIYLTDAMRSHVGGAIVFNLTSPESSYIAALLETGAVGFLALLSVFAFAWTRAYRSVGTSLAPAMTIGVLAAMTAILMGNLTIAGFTSDHNEMLLGLLVGMASGNWSNP
jgi:O-antigen ligase